MYSIAIALSLLICPIGAHAASLINLVILDSSTADFETNAGAAEEWRHDIGVTSDASSARSYTATRCRAPLHGRSPVGSLARARK